MRTAMPSSSRKTPSLNILCAPPTDPTGFIYPSYRAAGTETHRHKPSLDRLTSRRCLHILLCRRVSIHTLLRGHQDQ